MLTGPGGLGPVTTIGTLNGSPAIATCVNDAGEVAGIANVGSVRHIFVSGPQGSGPLKDLGSLGNYVTDINASGQVYGQYFLNGYDRGFLSEPGEGDTLKDLGLVPGFDGIDTTKVNNSGQVTGTAYAYNGANDLNRHAFISGMDGNGPLRDLGTLGGISSYGEDINASGQVAGYSDLTGDKLGHAFLSGPDGGPLQDLGSLAGSRGDSGAYGVNDAGQVVGNSSISSDNLVAHAFLYSDGVMMDLNNLTTISPGYVLDNASQITNSGFILASGYSVDDFGEQEYSAFLLTPTSTPPPVPEASTVVSFGLLLALGGVMIAKRKKARAAV